ncbi:MAG TPA: phosphatase PAP2 family protein [Steroidobacteraceae bacterium]|nr:phosphatase PAP2 family protein [Steroidobacteraceae bacterium]
MKLGRRLLIGSAVFVVAFAAANWWSRLNAFNYLDGDTDDFVASFAAPSPPGFAGTRVELDELLELQRTRTKAQVEAAQADRKKDVSRFYAALGLPAKNAPDLPALHDLTDDVEDDIAPYIRAVKGRFRRLRPYEIEKRLKPCIGDVQGDMSYPSGHAAYGYVMAYLLEELVPERRAELEARADEFARQRLVCGVHFRSDLEAGRAGARMLVELFDESPGFRADEAAAAQELRAALKLPPRSSD